MVRNYIRKRPAAQPAKEDVNNATEAVLRGDMSVRVAAETFHIKKSTLFDRIKKAKSRSAHGDSGMEEEREEESVPNFATRQVFTTMQETELKEYLKTASKMFYGLTYTSTRKLAYEFAVMLERKYPLKWDEQKIAGIEWMRSFMKRHPDLSYRKAENVSMGRASAFNRANIDLFFHNYALVQEKFNFEPHQIWNMDETGVSTVLQAPKIIAEKGNKTGQCVSGERGSLVTFCGTISATGASIPPMYLYPRVNMKNYFLHGAVAGAVGAATKTGWMTTDTFIKYLEHFQKHTNASKSNRKLLLLDNHETHVSPASIRYCRDNGIELLSFPPHCTHEMQPLDKCVYGPFKQKCKVSFNDHIASNPGKPITIHDIAKLTAEPYLQTFTPKNILSGFRTTGVWPVDRLVYTDDKFLPSLPTDRPDPNAMDTSQASNMTSSTSNVDHVDNRRTEKNERISYDTPVITTTVCEIDIKSATDLTKMQESNETIEFMKSIIDDIICVVTKPKINIISVKKVKIALVDLKPFPKAAPRKPRNTKAAGKSRIYTSTPEKNRIEELENNRKTNAKKKGTKRNLMVDKHVKGKNAIGGKKSKKGAKKVKDVISSTSSESEPEQRKRVANKNPFTKHSSDSDIEADYSDDDQLKTLLDDDRILPGDYLLVRFSGKKNYEVHYVGLVTEIAQSEGFVVKFMRLKKNGFHFPEKDDIALVSRHDVVAKLPEPSNVAGSSRMQSFHKFNVSFFSYNVQ